MNSPRNPHGHKTIGEAGSCPECRVYNISRVEDCPKAFVIMFPDADPHALSLVRDWGDDPATTAWATGCNLPEDHVHVMEIPMGVALECGFEMFRLHEGADADEALRVIDRMLDPQ